MAVGCSQSVIARDTPPFPAFFDVAVTKFTHAAESSQNVPTRGGNEAQKEMKHDDEHVAHCSLMG